MSPRYRLLRRSRWLEHNQCRSLFLLCSPWKVGRSIALVFLRRPVVLPPIGIGPPTAKLDRAMLRGVRCEGTARETRAADVQDRHPVFRVGPRVPKCLHSYRIARAKSESGSGCAEIGDAPQHLAAHYSEFRTRHPAVTSFHPSPTAK